MPFTKSLFLVARQERLAVLVQSFLGLLLLSESFSFFLGFESGLVVDETVDLRAWAW